MSAEKGRKLGQVSTGPLPVLWAPPLGAQPWDPLALEGAAAARVPASVPQHPDFLPPVPVFPLPVLFSPSDLAPSFSHVSFAGHFRALSIPPPFFLPSQEIGRRSSITEPHCCPTSRGGRGGGGGGRFQPRLPRLLLTSLSRLLLWSAGMTRSGTSAGATLCTTCPSRDTSSGCWSSWASSPWASYCLSTSQGTCSVSEGRGAGVGGAGRASVPAGRPCRHPCRPYRHPLLLPAFQRTMPTASGEPPLPT